MLPPAAYDLTRLFIGPIQCTPRGIDRLDLGLASHFLKTWPGDCVATLPTPLGVRCVSRETAMRVIETVVANWGETADPNAEPLFASVKKRLVQGGGAQALSTRTPNGRAINPALAVAKIAKYAGCALGPLAIKVVPKGALYLNAGQVGIALPQFLLWLKQRPDVKPVFMLHDTIPLDHAEYVPQNSPKFHQNMIDNTARYAAGLIVTTRAAERSIRRELHRAGRGDIAAFAQRAPVAPIFAQGGDPDPELAGVPYFVIAGAIEPRKNHLLLLNVWRELLRQDGRKAPKLVIVGSRSRRNGHITDILKRSRELQEHVFEVSGLSSPGLRRLLSNACALLMPSFAEGFGLPIVEALALGTPVIASDLEAHIEAGGPHATYLSPIDGLGWLSAVCMHVQRQTAFRQKLAGHRVFTWTDYLNGIEPFLLSLHQGVKYGHATLLNETATAAE
jgi:glycosyltransferase involved in cell wall biosynthesis